MTRIRSFIILFCGALFLGACSPAYTGFSGDVMLTSGLPHLAIAPAGSLEPMLTGRTLGNLESDTSIRAGSEVNYAVYGDSGSGPVQRHGHVLVSRLGGDTWEFLPESYPNSNEVYLKVVDLNGQTWTEHLLYVESAGDWFSALWEAGGRAVPEKWLGKRWSRTYASSTRVVVEYREPMPTCIETGDNAGQSYVTHAVLDTPTSECTQQLKAFEARADAAFDIQSARGQEFTDPAPAAQLFKKPDFPMNMTRLVGKARASDRSSDKGDNWL
ncbi:MAG: DUF4851 domain-containing protein [Deltaproteobacteria bacterium]|jgi:hypothetical protein|nr:DUF4851 domain-containing protein [Deltaproteobacteria bacterium]